MHSETEELNKIRVELLNDFFLFTRFFFEKKTGREFIVSKPEANESHFIEIAREFTKVFNLETLSLWLNCPPGWSKSELCKSFICWSMARYPDAKFLYISYSHDLASAHTHSIRETMCMPLYKRLFAVDIKRDSSAKDFFQTTDGGAVAAFGSSGSITGRDAGLPGLGRFSGCIIIDDISKPDEIHSENIRNSIKRNYEETILMRLRSANVPIIVIGQRLHEDDIFAYLASGKDGRDWKKVIIKALDDAGNARYPEVLPLKQLHLKKQLQPYVFASQYQQDPIPEGGGLFRKEWFPLLDEWPDIFSTFITCDTAETDKNYNDATVFSFWGVYQVKMNGDLVDDLYALHWIDCKEMRVEPKELMPEFLDFWSSCMRFKVKPKFAAIEKKSTGVTLGSVLKDVQGLHVIDIPRSGVSKSKTNRFLQMQQYIANKQLTLPLFGKHTSSCIDHMTKITSNNVHAFDDICFIAGTKIATLFGYKKIENITTNDLIITPFGIRKVLASGLTGHSIVIKNKGLIGTANHPIYSNNSFKRLDSVYDADKINLLSLIELIKWKYLKLLHLMESNIILRGREGIILAHKNPTQGENVLKDFMFRFGNFIIKRQLKKATSFITKMVTLTITTLLTWSVFQTANTLIIMQKKGLLVLQQIKSWNICLVFGLKHWNGIKAKRVEIGIEKMQKPLFVDSKNLLVDFVRKVFLKKIPQHLYVVNLAEEGKEDHYFNVSHLTASSAIVISPEKILSQNLGIEKLVQENALEKKQDVYNLTVEIDHVYYANGILVSNCDTAYDAIRFALIDKIIINKEMNKNDYNEVGKNLMLNYNKVNRLRKSAYS